MNTASSGGFLGTKLWLQAVARGRDWILCHTSALEYLQLFIGYLNETQIYVYAKEAGEYKNVDYKIVDTFDNIDYVCSGGVLYTSLNQTVNDMLADFDNIDEQSLIEGLSTYYYNSNESFEGLIIRPENQAVFDSIKDWAIEYYDEY